MDKYALHIKNKAKIDKGIRLSTKKNIKYVN